MDESRTLSLIELTLHDLLTVDAYDKALTIVNSNREAGEELIGRRQFFARDGLYVEPEEDGLVLIDDSKPKKGKKDNKRVIKLEDFKQKLEESYNSIVVLIEGYAGCGKSTLVQKLLLDELGFISDYYLYNYNIEAQNDELTHDINGTKVQESSIFNAIRTCFVHTFCKNYYKRNESVLNDFLKMTKHCESFRQLQPLYYSFINTDTFEDALSNLRAKRNDTAWKLLYQQLGDVKNYNCILALDYILRLSLWKNGLIKKLFLCYDNLDAIEDAIDLAGFDDIIVLFRNIIDTFINSFMKKYPGYLGTIRPHFVIIATYRKITSVLVELDKAAVNNENLADGARAIPPKGVYHIDATSSYSYKKIVQKRKDYFERYLKNYPVLHEKEVKKRITDLISDLDDWNSLNQSLEIMKNRYSILWNRNYRSCSLIADILFSEDIFDFDTYLTFINKSIKDYDGYLDEYDQEGNNVLSTYFGRSAIFLSCVCRVFNYYDIWDKALILTKLHANDPEKFVPTYNDVSLSRIILTYIYNCGIVSLKDLYEIFCQKGLFSVDKLCSCLSLMLERNEAGVWRRPIYYANKFIPAVKAEVIKRILMDECKLFIEEQEDNNYMFQLCDSGRAYVERLMCEFEFFSNRLSFDNKPLYMYKRLNDLKRIMSNVYNAVNNCCLNMICFKDKYMSVHNISLDEYLRLNIHPKTAAGSYQLHTERIIFSHIGYINNARLYFINRERGNIELRKKYNSLFIEFISKYLKLYKEHISTFAKGRERVYLKLNCIVNIIQMEDNKEKPDEKTLFQSVSLNQKIRNR